MSEEQAAVRTPLQVEVAGAVLEGDLVVPPGPEAVVLFAHGSGSSRRSPRNQEVAAGLQRAGFATLLLDLLTAEEDHADQRTRAWRFHVPLLAQRLTAAVDQLAAGAAPGPAEGLTAGLPVGLFGASTGAAAALHAAADQPPRVYAVVSRGGRPDLAQEVLPRVRVPTLLVVGGEDLAVLDLNEQAAARLGGFHEIAVVPGASHLFEEPGALAEVTRLAAVWLREWLPH